MRLSIVIVTYNSSADIDRCLASLRDHPASTPLSTEIVVVDNHSRDATVAVLRERWPAIPIIDIGTNAGFARANNVGFRQTTGELVLFLNPDTIVRPGALDRLTRALLGQPDAAAAGPRLIDGYGRPELSFGAMPGPLTELRQKLLVRGSQRRWPLVSAKVERLTAHPHTVDWVSGACLLARRPDVEAAGLFDERYFMYLEDVDLCAALRATGRTILFVPDAEVVHFRGQSRSSAPGPTAAAYRASQLAFYEKHRPAWAPILRHYLKLRGVLPDKRDNHRGHH
jgi:GT2 family glycosyltransferase